MRAATWWWLRLVPAAAIPVVLMVSTYPGRFSVPAFYWLLAMCAAAAFVVGDRYPFAVSLVVSALAGPMFATDAWGASSLVPYLGAVCLAEAAIRLPGHTKLVVATAAWAAAYTVGSFVSDPVKPAAAATSTAVFVGGPVLIGLYIRAQRNLAATYRQRAADIESATRASERNAVARELHDVVAHHMAAIVLQVGVARHLHHDLPPRVRTVLDDVHDTASAALADIRALLTALRDPTVHSTTVTAPDALRSELAAVVDRTRAAGFEIDSRLGDHLDELDAISGLTVLRVFQEAMTNVMKHAATTTTVTATVLAENGGTAIHVINSRSDAAPPRTGQGLVGMSERTELVGGWVRTRATAEQWTLDAWIPHAAPGGSA